MAPITPGQQQWRSRFELLIRAMAPVLDSVLMVGDRISRVADRSDDEPVPAIRFPDDVRPLGPGTPPPEAGR